MSDLPGWALRAADGLRLLYGREMLAAELVRVLGPEREEMEAERTSLLEQHAILGAKVEVAEAAARVAEGLLKHVTQERDAAQKHAAEHHIEGGCMTCLAIETERNAAEAENERLANLLKTTRDPNVVELTSERDSWRQQAEMHAADALRYGRERDAIRVLASWDQSDRGEVIEEVPGE